MTEQKKQTFGERMAGVSFNPSQDPRVDDIKAKFAAIIDQLHELQRPPRDTEGGQEVAIYAMAIEHAFIAQMCAVKALTWRK